VELAEDFEEATLCFSCPGEQQLVLAGLHSSEQGDIKALCFAKLPGMFWG